ncbi:cation:proton antiporter [Rhizobium sp. RU36D]|uniref:cation:proton antiporter n=1 Tax=Rhizobium sp. RU36D TaxID=1907415 RepID=UPI0009D88DF4|nr:cation:proton antiporter [Rhizobium sp. RU36D]SMC59687.1 monovalent cation:H+ antiporter-2, CPA2 family [Rhizobium sp. RU36D]
MTGTVPEAAGHGGALVAIAGVIAIATLLGLLFLWLRQPPLVGFIVAGVALGPTGLELIDNSENVALFAEMGVVVLLFFIGMELSVRAFVLSLRQALLVMGGQLLAAMLLALGFGMLIEATAAETIILGFIIGMSSTVVAMKMLEDMGVLRGNAGRVAIGVLIAQDIAVVPMLIFVTSLGRGAIDYGSIALRILVAVALLAGVLWWFGKHVKLKVPFAERVEHKIELLALGALGLCFTAAALSGIAGLSPAYGAFLAGILVGNSTLRSRVIPVIEPIQSVLLVIFFLSIGLLIDLDFIREFLWQVLGLSVLVTTVKTILNIFLLRKTGSDPQTALIAGLSMAQIGEFSFVLAAAGFSSGALGFDLFRLSIAVTAVSLLLSPLWVSLMHRLENLASERLENYRQVLRLAYARELNEVVRGRDVLKHIYNSIRLAIGKRR